MRSDNTGPEGADILIVSLTAGSFLVAGLILSSPLLILLGVFSILLSTLNEN